MENNGKKYGWIRIGVYALLFAVIAAILYFALQSILPGFFDILRDGDQKAIEDYIRSFVGIRGIAMTLLLQFVQVISMICPGGPIQVAAGVVFGMWLGYAVCEAGYLAANVLVFLAARRLGSRMDRIFPVEGGSKKFRFISDSKHPAFMVFMGCIMPFMPNGIVPYVAARTNIKTGPFALAVLVGSTPTFIMLCAIGNRLLKGDFVIVAIIVAVFVAAVVLLVVKRDAAVAFAEKLRERLSKKRDK